jgi:site-specific DNA-methyltransferase (adenine-specific)
MKTKYVTIGNATLYNGDCFDILPKLDVEFDALITDPPYGISDCGWDYSIPLDTFWDMVERKTKPTANFVLFACGKFTVALVNSNPEWYRYDMIWVKNKKCGFLNANLQPLRNHESILVFVRPGFFKKKTYNPQKTPGGRTGVRKTKRRGGVYRSIDGCEKYYDGTMHPCSVLHFKNETGQHPTQKPVPLMEHLVKSCSNEGDIVVDPFMGSGSTGVAAINSGRRFIGIEREQHFFDIAVQRLEQAYTEHQNNTEVNDG